MKGGRGGGPHSIPAAIIAATAALVLLLVLALSLVLALHVRPPSLSCTCPPSHVLALPLTCSPSLSCAVRW